MDAGRKSALRRHHAELRTGIIVNNLLPDLHCAARGFLTDVEFDVVSSKSCNVSQVDALIEILLTKESEDFDSFCRVLEKGEYRRWSKVLSQSASSTKQGAPGTTECVLPHPLIHSIKAEYLKVKDAFCGSPNLPSLEALKDRCDDLIHVAFADESRFSHHEGTIQKIESVRELANILFFRLSRWISFDFLDNVIEHFQPELKGVKEQLAQYKEKLKEILMQKLKHIGDLEQQEEEKETSDGLELTEIVAKYRLDADGLRVQDLVTERDFIAQRLGIPEHLLQVLSWRPGSVIIVFLLLWELQPLVELTLRRRDVRASLTSHGVEAIFVSGCSSNLVDRSLEYQSCGAEKEDMSDARGSMEAPVEESTTQKPPKKLSTPRHPPPSEVAGWSGRGEAAVSLQTSIDPKDLSDFLPGAMAERWFDVAVKLGCKDRALELRSSPDPLRVKCFLVIDEWMNKVENACWEYLCGEVLRSEGVGLGHIADRIEKNLNLTSSCQASSQTGGSVEAKDCEIQQLQVRVKELENDCKQLEADKQQQMKELAAKCVAAEEGKRGAEEDRIRMERELAEKDKILCDDLYEKDRLEREFEQYRISQGELVRDLTAASAEVNQKLAETNADTTARLALLAQHRAKEVAELEKRNEQLVADNAVLDKENEEYSEELADMKLKIAEMEAELKRKTAYQLRRHVTHFASSPSYISEEVLSPEAASLAVKDVLECSDEGAQNHLKTFFEIMDTSSGVATYTSGSLYRDWRCLAEHVGLQVTSLQDISCEKRLSIIFEEWGRKETVTVAKVHQVLMRSQCTRAAGCLGSAALLQRMMSQEDGILDLEEEPDLELFC